jgi:hypothetical protein
VHIVDGDVDLGDLKSSHPLDRGDDGASQPVREIGDRHP